MNIRAAGPGDLSAAIELLRQAQLPTADLTAASLALVAEDDTGTLGVIGIDAFGPLGLLRSLVVAPAARGRGTGRSLAAALERTAHARGIKELWLLTIDAERFFADLGFVVRSRDDAPGAIRGSEEFSSLCPGDAVLMSKATAAS